MTVEPQNLARLAAAFADQAIPSLQIVSAGRLAGQYYPQVDPGQPLLLTTLDTPEQVLAAANVLLRAYPSEHRVTLIDNQAINFLTLASVADKEIQATALDWAVASLYIPPLEGGADYLALQEIVARLRAPDGCPWDRALTWEKLRPSLLEETYELLAALDQADPVKVAEEQGDLLLQIALQTQIAIEGDLLRSPDIIRGIVGKLIRRHPHVFGEVTVSGTDEVLANWEAIKAAERAGNHEPKRSPLAGVPTNLPALAQADAYLDRMSRLRAVDAPTAPWARLAALPPDKQPTPDLVGQTLLDFVAWARARGIDTESALRAANAAFAARVAENEADGQ